MRRKSLKVLSLLLTAVMVLSVANPGIVATATEADSVMEQQVDATVETATEDVTTDTTTEVAEDSTEAVADEATEVAETTTEAVAEETTTATDAATETTTEVVTEEATEVATSEEKIEMIEEEVPEKQMATGSLVGTMNSTLLDLVVKQYNAATGKSYTSATLTADLLAAYTGALDFSSATTSQINAITSVEGLGTAVKASSINISKLTKVTSIADEEFLGCQFTSFTMPTSITSIGDKAFYECTKMTSINTGTTENKLPSNLKSLGQQAFCYCSALTTITIPTLSDEGAVGAFQNCAGLTSIKFGSGVTKIPVDMFRSAGTASTGLNVTFGTGLDKILGSAFQGATFASGHVIDLSSCTKMTGIDASAFKDAKNVTTVILPSSLDSLEIGAYAFALTTLNTMYASGSVKSGVYMPDYVTKVGDGAFYGNTVMTEVTLSSALSYISDYTFDGCTSLATVKSGKNTSATSAVTWIGDCAFRDTAISSASFLTQMTKLTQIGRQLHDTIDDGSGTPDVQSIPLGGVNTTNKTFDVSNINKKQFDNKPVGSEVFTGCNNLTSVTLPGSVRVIAQRAFYSTGIQSITWSNATTATAGVQRKIWAEGFAENVSLDTMRLPQNTGEALIIGPAAFVYALSLTTVGTKSSTNNTLPNTISSIGSCAFMGCQSLEEIHIQAYGSTAPALKNQTFEGCYSLATATLPKETTLIPWHFFAACPLTSFNFADMSNLVKIEQLAFLGHQFTKIDLSASKVLVEIGAFAFAGYDSLKKTYIKDYTIGVPDTSLPKLTTMILPQTVTADGLYLNSGVFAYQEKFTTLYKKGSVVSNKVVIPSYVTKNSGESDATFAWTGVSSVTWEADTNASAANNRWTTVGPNMFKGCENITDAKNVLPRYVVNLGQGAFAKSEITSATLTSFTNLSIVGWGSSLDTANKGVFANCVSLESVAFPTTTTATNGIVFKDDIFLGDVSLTTVALGAVTTIGKQSFKNCTGLLSIDLKKVKTVDNYAFQGCTGLATVDFGVVEKINNYAFQACNSLVLTNTPLPNTLVELGQYAFYQATSLGKVTFGSGLVKIGAGAFASSGVTSVDFTKASALTTINQQAFQESSIKKFDISGTQVAVIPTKMLFNCPNLTEATFGEEVEYISDNAISGCPVFKTLSFYTTTTVDERIFATKGTNNVITGQNNGSSTSSNITITVTAKTPDEVIIPMDRELDFPYYVNRAEKSNIHYISIVDADDAKNGVEDFTIEEYLYVRAETNGGYYKVQNSDKAGDKYKVSSTYYKDLDAAEQVKKNNQKIDVIKIKGLKESGSRNLIFNVYADIQFEAPANSGVTITSSSFNAAYNIKIQDPQTTAVLYSDNKWTKAVPLTDHIQATKTNMSICYYYDLMDAIETGAEQDNYNIVVESSNPEVLAVGATSTLSKASGSCTTAATASNGVTTASRKNFYMFPKGIGTATITLYPAIYEGADKENHKKTYTFTVNSNINVLSLAIPSEYNSKLNPGSEFSIFKSYTNFFGQECSQANMADFKKLTNSNIIFESDAPDYVSVDQYGNVKILKADATTKRVVIKATYPAATGTTYKTLTLNVTHPTTKAKEEYVDSTSGSKVVVTKVSKTDLEGEVTYKAPANTVATTVTVPGTVTVNGVKYKVTAIEEGAFKNNKKIKTVTIGSNVKTIGKNAFYGCTAMTKVVIPKTVETIGEKAFYGCKKLKTVSLSSSAKVKTIGKSAFQNCIALTKITIPKATVTIDQNAFYNCKKLATVSTHKKGALQTIGKSAFGKCVKLKKITLPSKVRTIGEKAFYNCKVLKTITIKSTVLSTVGKNALKGIHKKATIKVPKSKLTVYQTLLKGKGQKSSVKIKK